MSDFKDVPDFVEVNVKSEFNLNNTFLPENDDYNFNNVKKENEDSDNDEGNTSSLEQTNDSYYNFICKEEIKDEGPEFTSEKQQKLEQFTENSEADEKIDISEFQLSEFDDNEFKIESENDSENQKSLTQRKSPFNDPLEEHKMESKQPLTTRINCQFCNKPFAKKNYLDDHILKQHKDEIKGDLKSFITSKIHSCHICNSYKTTNKHDIVRHLNLVHNDEKIKLKCQFCTESFVLKQSLDGHILKKHKDNIKNNIKSFITSKIYVCKLCTESFVLKQSLDRHILKKHKDDIKNNIKSFITSKIYVCKLCNSYETMYKSCFDQHVNSVHNEVETKKKCQFCSESFICKKSLDGHVLRKHKDKIKNNMESFITDKIHVCTICNTYETTIKWCLDRHINSMHHEVKNKMKCQFCTKSFMCKLSLDGHVLRKHKDKMKNDIKSFITSKIYVCKVCNAFETTLKSNLQKHNNAVHNKEKNKLNCQFCTKSFVLQKSLDSHILKKHKDKIKGDIKSVITSKILSCNLCSFETTVKYVLETHVSNTHEKSEYFFNVLLAQRERGISGISK